MEVSRTGGDHCSRDVTQHLEVVLVILTVVKSPNAPGESSCSKGVF